MKVDNIKLQEIVSSSGLDGGGMPVLWNEVSIAGEVSMHSGWSSQVPW